MMSMMSKIPLFTWLVSLRNYDSLLSTLSRLVVVGVVAVVVVAAAAFKGRSKVFA